MKKMVVKYVLDQPKKEFDAFPGPVVHVQLQHGHPTIWVETNLREDYSFQTTKKRTFTAVPTGAPFETGAAQHLGTVVDLEGWMVWHIYEGEVDL